jgi:uncharacterized repeat protein (TIGR01451 family)
VAALLFVASLVGPVPALAATAPTLGAAAGYGVFGVTAVTNDGSATSHVWGNVGSDTSVTGLDDTTQVDGTINVPAPGVAAAALSAYGQLAGEAATGALNLSGTNTVGPGVYTVGATTLNGTLTLSGAGVYIFRSSSSVSTSGAAVVNLTNGADACNVFWQIPTSMTIGSGTVMVGTIITDTGLISLDAGASLKGRALAHTGVTMITNQITEPTCATALPPPAGQQTGTLTVVKSVINDNGGSKTIADFSLFVDGDGRASVDSGHSNNFLASNTAYTVSESPDAQYVRAFSGDCDSTGRVFINAGDNKFCIVTNNDIGAPVVVPPVPPLIDVVKVPNPLSLPAGPGQVDYAYTLRNVGTVPVTNVTMVGDTCSPIVLASGDLNGDAILQVNETWVYRCSTTLLATHTNTVVATGRANGLTATDIANATVVVGVPLVPPLIHVTKIPSPLTLLVGGGQVTYTERVTNPGAVALSNVRLTDDKCSPLTLVSGDVNGDALLQTNETWTYTCRTNLTATTTNTAVAIGEANGFTVRDVAIATVVVAAAAPALPSTGFAPAKSPLLWAAFAAGILAVSLLLSIMRKKQAE